MKKIIALTVIASCLLAFGCGSQNEAGISVSEEPADGVFPGFIQPASDEPGYGTSIAQNSQPGGETPLPASGYIEQDGLVYSLKGNDQSFYVSWDKKEPLTEVTIPATMKGFPVTEIRKFKDCKSLQKVHLSWGITSITVAAFYGCSSLLSIDLPDSLLDIGSHAFHNCDSLKTISIPAGVEIVSSDAFHGCVSLEVLEVDSENAQYHSSANCLIETATKTLVSGCKTSVIPSDGSVQTIGDDAFRDMKSLKSIVIPDSVKRIGTGAFAGTGLSEIVLGNGVTVVSGLAFEGCGSLEEITLPASLKQISWSCLKDCPNLKKIIYKGTAAQWSEVTAEGQDSPPVEMTFEG